MQIHPGVAIEYSKMEDWLQDLDSTELGRQGWSLPALQQSLQKYPISYLTDGQQIASVIIYQHLDKDLVEVLFLATCQRFQQQGRMAALLQKFKDYFAHSASIWLECREDNLVALSLYRKLGFRENGRRANYYKDGTSAILFDI